MRYIVLCIALGLGLLSAPDLATGRPAPRAWREGVNYTRLQAAVPKVDQSDGIEVVEVFRYSCGVCNAFEPQLVTWLARKPQDVTLVRIPVAWTTSQKAEARLFLTLRALHREDLHQSVYDMIHKQRMPLTAPFERDSELLQSRFAEAHGIAPGEFMRAFDSADVRRAMTRAEELVRLYRATGTPTIIVDGTYTTTLAQAGGFAQLIAVTEYLISLERSNRARATQRLGGGGVERTCLTSRLSMEGHASELHHSACLGLRG